MKALLVLMVLATIGLTSCQNDVLEPQPSTQITTLKVKTDTLLVKGSDDLTPPTLPSSGGGTGPR